MCDDRKIRVEEDLLECTYAKRLAGVFKALADPTRLRITSLLAHHELCVYDIASTIGISQSAVSHQLRLMRDMRVVKNRKVGRMVYYCLNDDHIHDLFDRGVEHVVHA